MKYSEMNQKQQRAVRNIKYASNDIIGGLENTLLDYDEQSQEYINAYELLHNHEALVETIYKQGTTCLCGENYVCFDKRTCKEFLREINFCGTEFLMMIARTFVKRAGY